MKKIFLTFGILFLVGCNGAAPSNTLENHPPETQAPEPTPPEPAHVMLEQPYIFETVSGPHLYGSLMQLEETPSGRWLVANREGILYLLDQEFQMIKSWSIPTYLWGDAGLVSFVLDPDYENNHFLYAFFALTQDEFACPCAVCSVLARFTVHEEGDSQLISDRINIKTFIYTENGASHFGGSLAIRNNGNLTVAVGNGQSSEEAALLNPIALDMGNDLGKVHEINLQTLESKTIARGLRQPFTMINSNQGIFIGDVGSDYYESIEFLSDVASDSLVSNFGWPLQEVPEENPPEDFLNPVGGWHHCTEQYQDEDPYGHSVSVPGVKFHNGVEHPCGNEFIVVLGSYQDKGNDRYGGKLTDKIFYSSPDYGFIRGFKFQENQSSEDEHIAHENFVFSLKQGSDGYLYGVKFIGNRLVRLLPNPNYEAEADE